MSGSVPMKAFEKAAGKPRRSSKPKPPPPLSIRFTDEERARLERDAGELSLSAYVRQMVLGEAVCERQPRYQRKQRRPSIDEKTLAGWLGMLGQSELASSMMALALAAQSGALPVTPELSEKLDTACDDIHDMRIALIVALRIKPESGASSFAPASED